jgi:hypothetical protein
MVGPVHGTLASAQHGYASPILHALLGYAGASSGGVTAPGITPADPAAQAAANNLAAMRGQMALLHDGAPAPSSNAVNVQALLQGLAAHLAGTSPTPGGQGNPLIPASDAHVDTGYNPAQYQLAMGNTGQAATDWMGHHQGHARLHMPAWLVHYLTSQIHGHYPHAPAPAPVQPAPPVTVS